MEINWLWDSRLGKQAVKKILQDEEHPRFELFMEKLLSRVNEPKIVFRLIDELVFCKHWPLVKRRMEKDRWLSQRVIFWQVIYERIHERLKKRGMKLRHPVLLHISKERLRLAEQIRKIRRRLGYTQSEAAQKLGVIQQYFSRIEGGRENVSLDTLKKIADAFGRRLIIRLV